MNRFFSRRQFTQIAATGLATLFAVTTVPVFAQDGAVQDAPAAAQDLPSANDIIEMNIESMGGRAALEAVSSMASTASMTIPGPGGDMQVTVEVKQSGEKFLMQMELPGMGSMRQGSNGEVYWMENPMMGAQILEGNEMEAAKQRFSTMFPQLGWSEYDGEISVTGKESVDGTDCYVVVFTPAEGPATTRYFNAENGQTVKEAVTQESPMGPVTMETFPSDYRDVNGLMLPFMNTTVAPQGEMEVTFDEYQINLEIDDSVFVLPENIQKMVDEAGEADGGSDG
ncbi:MAG: hypothetical protein AAF456_02160 [Planctomycetota bacterium]